MTRDQAFVPWQIGGRWKTGLLMFFLVILALAGVRAFSQEVSRTWVRVRAPELAGRSVELGDFRRGTTPMLSGVDSTTDGLWLPLPVGAEASALNFDPPLSSPPVVEIVELPAALSSSWAVVPLPLGAWGVNSLSGVASFRVSRGRGGRFRASSMHEVVERASSCPPVRTPPPPMRFPQRVADFESGPLEPLDNRFGFFAGRGGVTTGARARDGISTRLVVTASLDVPKSFGGFWLQLAPSSWLGDAEAGVDARGLEKIAIRGRGTPRGVVKISDVEASRKEQSVVIGVLDGPVDEGASWLRVLSMPDKGLDLSRLRSLVIDLTPSGGGSVEIEEIVFLGRDDAPPPMYVPDADGVRAGPVRSGLWVWNTKELLDPASEWKSRLWSAIDRWALTEVYLQLPHEDGDRSLGDWSNGARSEAMATLIEELHRGRVEVHALDGAAWLALPEARGELVSLAKSVRDYNRSHGKVARFDALHLDIEPYLLPGFGGRRRSEILASLVEGLTITKETLDSIPLWLDIPFWYDSTEEATVETGPRAGCARPDFLREVFDIADGIGVMSYRTRADGADGLTSTALGELALGRECAKPVRLGIETIALLLEEAWSLRLTGGSARAGDTIAALPPRESGYVFFTTSVTGDELRWLAQNGYRILVGEPGDAAPPSKITFFGRSAEDIRGVVDESLELARRAGFPADGVVYHELRTLP